MKLLKMTRPDVRLDHWCIVGLNHSLQDEFEGAEVGDSICIEVVEMTDEEFKALPEFEGW